MHAFACGRIFFFCYSSMLETPYLDPGAIFFTNLVHLSHSALWPQLAALAKSSRCKSMGIVLPEGCNNGGTQALAQVRRPALPSVHLQCDVCDNVLTSEHTRPLSAVATLDFSKQCVRYSPPTFFLAELSRPDCPTGVALRFTWQRVPSLVCTPTAVTRAGMTLRSPFPCSP